MTLLSQVQVRLEAREMLNYEKCYFYVNQRCQIFYHMIIFLWCCGRDYLEPSFVLDVTHKNLIPIKISGPILLRCGSLSLNHLIGRVNVATKGNSASNDRRHGSKPMDGNNGPKIKIYDVS